MVARFEFLCGAKIAGIFELEISISIGCDVVTCHASKYISLIRISK